MILDIQIFHQSSPSDPHIDKAQHKANYHSSFLYKYDYEPFKQISTMRTIREIISQAHVPKFWSFRHILIISAHTFVMKMVFKTAEDLT